MTRNEILSFVEKIYSDSPCIILTGSQTKNLIIKPPNDVDIIVISPIFSVISSRMLTNGNLTANFAPSLSFSGSMTSNYSNVPIQGFFQETSADPFFRQFKSNLYEYLGLTLNIPLYNNQIYRTAVNKAKINLEAAKIDEDLPEPEWVTLWVNGNRRVNIEN